VPEVTFRDARREDVGAIVAMLADDRLGAARETPSNLEPYLAAYDDLVSSGLQQIVVAERDGEVVGTAQLTYMAGLSHQGMRRCEIEAVRVRADHRGGGVGGALIRRCIALALEHGAGMVQLTSNATRTDARRFYERLGFTASHIGFKLTIEPP